MRQTLFTNGRVLACTGRDPSAFDGDILVEDDRIADVRHGRIEVGADVRVVDLGGSTIMPGLGDAHVHLNQPLDFEMDFGALMMTPPDDAALATAGVARQYVENGVTTCISAGVSQPRGDLSLKNVIDRGWVTGPRLVPGGLMISTPEGIPALVTPTSADEMRRAVSEQCELGVRSIKLFVSGENVMPEGSPTYAADDTYMSEELVETAVDEASRHGAFVHVHARSAQSIKISARAGARLISHASYVDDEGLRLLEERDDVWICPSLHYMWAMIHEAAEPYAKLARDGGYDREYEDTATSVARLIDAGIPVVPGGDYGHVWIPHGEAAHDLEHFVTRGGATPAQAVLMGTRNFTDLTGMKVGQLEAGFFADMIILDGDPSADITLLQDRAKRRAVVKSGKFEWVNPDRIDRL